MRLYRSVYITEITTTAATGVRQFFLRPFVFCVYSHIYIGYIIPREERRTINRKDDKDDDDNDDDDNDDGDHHHRRRTKRVSLGRRGVVGDGWV